eukprot:PhF_6_TR8720/c0_g1_i1/m.13688
MLEFTREVNDAYVICSQTLSALNTLMDDSPAIINSIPLSNTKASEFVINVRRYLLTLDKAFQQFVEVSAKASAEIVGKNRTERRTSYNRSQQNPNSLVPGRRLSTSNPQMVPSGGGGGGGGGGKGLTPHPPPPMNPSSLQSTSLSPAAIITSALHVALEAVCYHAEAERGAVLMKMETSQDLQCVCFVGGAHLSTQQIRLPPEGIVQTILTSGVALNLGNFGGDNSVRKFDGTAKAITHDAHSMLCVPILSIGHVVNHPVGILQLVNRIGREGFTPLDEAGAFHAAQQISYILQRYPVTPKCQVLEPARVLHNLVPFNAAKEVQRAKDILKVDVPDELMELVENHVVRQLVFRSRHVDQFIRKGVVATGKAMQFEITQAVGEMGDYINNLESCWRSTTEEVVIMEKEQAAAQNESKRRKMRLKLLEDALNETEKKCVRYKTEYDKLSGVVNNVLSTAVHFPSIKGAT